MILRLLETRGVHRKYKRIITSRKRQEFHKCVDGLAGWNPYVKGFRYHVECVLADGKIKIPVNHDPLVTLNNGSLGEQGGRSVLLR